MMNRKYLAVACLLVLGFVSSCSDDEDDIVARPSTTSSASMSATSTTSTSIVESPRSDMTSTPPAPVQTPIASPTEATSPTCPDEGWTTLDDPGTQQMVAGDVYDVRPVAAQCHDTVFFDVNTSEEVGFFAHYTGTGDGIQDGSGNQIEVEGSAALQIAIYAPVANYDLFTGYGFNPDPNWLALREVKFAGSFEGVTSFVIGVDHITAFAVEREHVNGKSQIVVRLAH